MSRSSLPQSVPDRIAAAFTLVTAIALVWLIATVPQESGATAAPEHAVAARQADNCGDVAAPGATDLRAQPETPTPAPAQLMAAF
jgi:hypothetical protein